MEQLMYLCKACKSPQREWTAQCPLCSAWNTIHTTTPLGVVVDRDDRRMLGLLPSHHPDRVFASAASPRATSDAAEAIVIDPDPDDCEIPIPITEVSREHVPRFITNIPALDHVLGGGLVPGGSVLIGGDPGSAKSTLSIQAAAACARWNGARVLYVTGEENTGQVAERAERVGANFDGVYLIRESDPDRILRAAERIDPEVLIVDSISTMALLGLPAMPGSVTQVRACAELLHAWCRDHHVALILIGHVTKDGAVAGPNTLKHLVDAVLHLEVIEGSQLRVLRAHKNRNGDTGAAGRFMMTKDGLVSIGDYSSGENDPGADVDPAWPPPGSRNPADYETVSTSMDIEMRGAMADAYLAAENSRHPQGGLCHCGHRSAMHLDEEDGLCTAVDCICRHFFGVGLSPTEIGTTAAPGVPLLPHATDDRESQATDLALPPDPSDSLS